MNYVVIEIQKYENGDIGTLKYDCSTKAEADNKFFTVMAAAAISVLPKHGAVLIDENGWLLRTECYDRTIQNEEDS